MMKSATALNKLVDQLSGQRNSGKSAGAPVDDWNPPFCGDLDMEIRRDGTWMYLGTPIGRPALVKLFSSVLRKDEDGKTYLVTPVEKVGIRVEDAPFVIVRLDRLEIEGVSLLKLLTNVGEEILVGPDHPLRFEVEAETMGVKPYVHVRGRLDALFSRACMHELINLGEHVDVDGVSVFAVQSAGQSYPIMDSAALAEAVAQ
ncbi:MAG: DUF1285 domain-containing protein [Pseudomonadota bacterium]